MDINEAIENLEYINWRYCTGKFDSAMRMAIGAVRAQKAAEKNDPLTLDELRAMDGQPVYVVPGNDEPLWGIVRYYGYPYDYIVCRDDIDNEFDEEDYAVCGVINDVCEWLAYRRPPKGDEDETDPV